MTKVPLIRDYMATNLITFTPDTEITRAMNVLIDAKISGAPVVDQAGNLVGILSKKDCLKAALNAAYYQDWGGTVADYMSTQPETLDSGLDLVKAAEAFLKSQYRRFPVLSDGRLVGQVSRYDILKGLSEQWGAVEVNRAF
ncbi:CBS domain-containing protein [Pseudohalocynthiibacter aestuariivivens]|jgi:CBS domain-containing protein|uniref:CBS domain-containing protein n=1 Tax=Pseudohalocynthiibacter aestuariivivens TaxID=1591409 RepID=A0ABV5JIV5_9RHOB|nr:MULTISPECIES: CBS domain-containing protein [Pseudohalocynthiibacter]MBS9716549.1 CBS domain-containing protein [Pseudohalocynthiibacter aestuariivivens]MCK0101619.1 CBS domain-containing protein [Pseudohalocynthiibacter sp. F2068]